MTYDDVTTAVTIMEYTYILPMVAWLKTAIKLHIQDACSCVM